MELTGSIVVLETLVGALRPIAAPTGELSADSALAASFETLKPNGELAMVSPIVGRLEVLPG